MLVRLRNLFNRNTVDPAAATTPSAQALLSAAARHLRKNRLDQARAAYEAARAAAQQARDADAEADALFGLCQLARRTGDEMQAVNYLRAATLLHNAAAERDKRP